MRLLIFFTSLLMLSPATAADQRTSAAKPEVYVIPFSHLDLFWGGTQEECLSRGNRIINRAIQLAKEHAEFRFLLEDEVFVANFLESRRGTEEVEDLKRLVKAGRIEIAPKWAGIYQNLPRGEALVRNMVLGKRHAREEMGVDPKVAHMGDIPGFTRQYPQILAKTGAPFMVMTRMGPPDKALFNWKSPDGSKAVVWDSLLGYGWGVSLGLHRDLDDAAFGRIEREAAKVQEASAGPVYMGWGTDLWSPNGKLIENVALLNRKLPASHFRFATPQEFFTAAAKARGIPELTGEIPSSWANLISSMSLLWPPVITATDTLLNAEKFAAINYALNYAPYPGQQFESLWKRALESMDHNNYGQGGDIGDERKLGHAQLPILEAGQILRDSLRNIAERVQHPFPVSTPIVVFNPLNWTRDDVVRAHVTLFGDVGPSMLGDYRNAMRLVDEKGTSIPFHVEQYSENISRAVELVFIARGVPSVGYKTYYLLPAAKADAFPNVAALKLDTDNDAKNPRRVIGSHVLENSFYRVTVDRAVGRIEVFDKELNRIVAKDLEISASEERGGNSLMVEPQTGRTVINTISSVEVEENNPVRAVVRIAGDVAGIPVVQKMTLYEGLKRIDLENTLDWKPGRFMKIEQTFPLQQPNAEVRTGVPFGSAATSDIMPDSGPRSRDEVPREIWTTWRQIHDWISAGTSEWGITISADHQFMTVGDNVIRGGMLRGTRYNPLNIVRAGRPYLLQQPMAGTYVYRYSLTSGKGGWAASKSWRDGMAFNTPLIPVSAVDDLSKKSLPPEHSFCSVKGDNLVVSAIKKADRDGAIVLRIFDERGEAVETPVRFLGQDRGFRTANMLEEESTAGEKKVLRVEPYEISTLKLQVK